MKGYVFMIDYKENKEDLFCCDQIECNDKEDLLQQIKLFANGEYSEVVESVKIIKDEERDVERPISNSLLNKIQKLLGYEIRTSW